jgi:hypothetical protein
MWFMGGSPFMVLLPYWLGAPIRLHIWPNDKVPPPNFFWAIPHELLYKRILKFNIIVVVIVIQVLLT